LPIDFKHLRSSSNQQVTHPYEFYNPNFPARQLGLGQLSPRLFFSNILKPREDITVGLQSLRIFQLGSDLVQYEITDWSFVTFTHTSYNNWWHRWHAHLFFQKAHDKCLALDESFLPKTEVNCSSICQLVHSYSSAIYKIILFCRTWNQAHQTMLTTTLHAHR